MTEVNSRMEPQKEALVFPLKLSKVSKETEDVMVQIKQLAESLLYHWKTFPIVLPKSITEEIDGVHQIFRDLFKAPTFTELEEVAQDSNGKLKKLTDNQLQQVWNTGEFSVDSINFPGQVHRWRLSNLLQKGSQNAQNTLLNDLARSLRLLIITARNRFISPVFSVTQSFKGIGRGFMKLLDILIGMPSNHLEIIEQNILEEHMRYLVAELTIKQNSMKDFEAFCNYVRQKCEELKKENTQAENSHSACIGMTDTTALKPPPIPYSYQTPNKLDIDLRLFNKDLINNCLPILSSILDRGSRGWYVHFRLKMMQDLQGQGLSNEEMTKRINKAIMEEYLDRVFDAIKSNTELENLQEGIGSLLVDQAKTVLTMKQAVQNVYSKMDKHRTELTAHLKSKYSIKSRIEPWMNEQIRAFENDFIVQNLYSAHEEAISICEEQGLKQAVYFLKRDLMFIKEREAILIKELGKETTPDKVFTFSTRIWLPSNYIVTKTTESRPEVIPTVVKNQLMPKDLKKRKDDIYFSVDKNTQKMTTSRYPFWRWWNYLVRTMAWMKNSMFVFGVVIPWCSGLSWRALFGVQMFYPDRELSQHDGALYKKESSKTHTLISRIRGLWEHVRQSRRKFEEAPDRGFLDKSFVRHLNRFWNYVVKGGLGTFLIAVSLPVLCIITSTLSSVLALTAPLWVPVATLLIHIAGFLIYDFDCPYDGNNKICILFEALIWNLLIQGCIQPISAVLVGSIGCPLASLTISIFGLIRRTLRGFWDTIMYYIMIKPRARIPSNDSFVARRIEGPGLASNYYFQIDPEQALAAADSLMEIEELNVWKSEMTRLIEQPKEAFNSFVIECLQPFSVRVDDIGVYKKLCIETSNYCKDLAVKVQVREKNLSTGLSPMIGRIIKMQERQLKLTILHCAKMLQDFYPKRIFPRMHDFSEDDFWEDYGLKFGDWRGLACKKLTDMFSPAFLIPLEGTDTHFHLEVKHLNLGRYVGMLESGEFHDDLDIVTEVHSPSGEVAVKRPNVNIEIFNPGHLIHSTAAFLTKRRRSWPWKPDWKPVSIDKLRIPLPIPHPASIAISIYNREHDQNQINYDDYYCQRIIKATKEKKMN